MITSQQLSDIFGRKKSRLEVWVEPLNSILPEFGINKTRERLAMFLAQTGHESGGYRVLRENLNYSATGLRKVFNKYFWTDELANEYARDQPRIASRAYANRIGNGDEASGDGWKFRGRGILQVTGRANYRAFTAWARVRSIPCPDFEVKPEALTTPVYAMYSACWFWESRDLNSFVDAKNYRKVTRRINGGWNGEAHRMELFGKALEVL